MTVRVIYFRIIPLVPFTHQFGIIHRIKLSEWANQMTA